MPDAVLQPVRYTSRFPAPLGYCGRETVNYHSAAGDHLTLDDGYSISRNLKYPPAFAAVPFRFLEIEYPSSSVR